MSAAYCSTQQILGSLLMTKGQAGTTKQNRARQQQEKTLDKKFTTSTIEEIKQTPGLLNNITEKLCTLDQ